MHKFQNSKKLSSQGSQMKKMHSKFQVKFLNDIDVLVQERCNSIVNALELYLSYTNPSIYSPTHHKQRMIVTQGIKK